VEYNIHQDKVWEEIGTLLGGYINDLGKVKSNPCTYLVLPVRIPLNSQKVQFRDKLLDSLNAALDGECLVNNYQISNWFDFSWRLRLNIKSGTGVERLCYLYGNHIWRRVLFGDVPSEAISMIEEVIMEEFYDLPLGDAGNADYIDLLSDTLLEPLAARLITIDRVHRYNDDRLRLDLIFEDRRYRLIITTSTNPLKKSIGLVNSGLAEEAAECFPEFSIFIED
jgi:hypothetical protein